MAERFSDSEKPLVLNQPSLQERLKEYPELKDKIETMLAIIENAGRDVEKAAEGERRMIEELRQMGNEVLHSWARRHYRKRKMSTTPSRTRIGRKTKALLVHASGENRNRRTDLHPSSAAAAGSTLFRICKVKCVGIRKPCSEPPAILDKLIPPSRNYGHAQTSHDGNGHAHLQATQPFLVRLLAEGTGLGTDRRTGEYG